MSRYALFVLSVAAALSVQAEGLLPVTMKILKPGAVRAERWLERQLLNQKEGLTGHAEELYDDIGKCDWLTGGSVGGQFSWERGPYYAKGLLPLAYELDDPELKAKVKRWADAYFASQRQNGDFGPREMNWWANMLVLHFMRDWYEVSGDERVIPFLERYFRFQKTALEEKPLTGDSCWATSRGGDELEIVFWLYEKTENEEWLDFARLIRDQVCDWAAFYADPRGGSTYPDGRFLADSFQQHIVNFNQGLKTPALFYRLSSQRSHLMGWMYATSPMGWAMRMCGRPDGMVNGTEPLTDRKTTAGTELCAQAERILSDQVAMSVLGMGEIGDDMESVAYNTLPGTLHPKIRGTRYYSILNQVACVNGSEDGRGRELGYDFKCNGACSAMAPGPEAGFGCCRSNFHMAWPKFVQSMWMGYGDGTADLSLYGGLAATAYGPCRVKANGFELHEETDYPFKDTVRVTVEAAPEGVHVLAFRKPAWTRGKILASVNGSIIEGTDRQGFKLIFREWEKGDVVELKFPAETQVYCDGNKASAYVKRGALLFAWSVPFKMTETEGGIKDFAKYELKPISGWNVALKLPRPGGKLPEPVYTEPFPENPFDPETPPMKLVFDGFHISIDGWGTFEKGSLVCPVEPPTSPLIAPRDCTLDLVPLGSTQTRLTFLPWAVKVD